MSDFVFFVCVLGESTAMLKWFAGEEGEPGSGVSLYSLVLPFLPTVTYETVLKLT